MIHLNLLYNSAELRSLLHDFCSASLVADMTSENLI